MRSILFMAASLLFAALPAPAQEKPRARDLGVPFDGTPGPLNAITDVAGVEVGHATLVRGDGPLVVGVGPVRTGVTAVFPLGKDSTDSVAAGWSSFNGDGEMTGTIRITEFGELFGPVVLTNTLSVGVAHAAVAEWYRRRVEDEDTLYAFVSPVVAETWDGFLNDIYGQHVTREDVFRALDAARGGPVAEGNVGGGTGMKAYDFKAGIGTASRLAETEQGRFTVGVLVQANYGGRPSLRIAGVPVGRELTDLMPESPASTEVQGNSIIVVIATDAPLLPVQLNRIARRAALGLGRNGSIGTDGSGDLFVAFTTAHRWSYAQTRTRSVEMMTDVTPLFGATVEATEEAIVNALVAAETMRGAGGRVVHALPHDRLREILRKYGRLRE